MTLATQRPPALDRLLDRAALRALLERHGRVAVLEVARRELDAWRCAAHSLPFDVSAFDCACTAARGQSAAAHLRPVFNLSGTVLHTNLGRAVMAAEAIEAVVAVMRGPSNLEFDLGNGRRGDRDDHIEGLLCELTGAEAATVVNNNAAAVLLVLAALAERREVLPCKSQIGSGTLPVERLESACIAISPPIRARRSGSFPERLAELARAWPIPVIGRIEQGRWLLDMRGLPPEDEASFLMQWQGADIGTLR